LIPEKTRSGATLRIFAKASSTEIIWQTPETAL